MPLHRLFATLGLCALLAACAAPGNPAGARLQAVRAFAAEAPLLDNYGELTERFRSTYQREKPFLSAQADVGEHLLDARRQAACDDLITLQHAVQAYLRVLGRLAGDQRYDLEDQVKGLGTAIKAWPDTGLDERHVNAYAGLTRLLARQLTQGEQDRSVQALLRDGAAPLQTLLDAMHTLLRYYAKTSANEARIVLGVLEVELPFADTPRDRLLAVLGKELLQAKQAEYRTIGRRYTLTGHELDALARQHLELLTRLDPPDPHP